MKRFVAMAAVVGILVMVSGVGSSTLPEHYSLLAGLRSPYRMVEPHLPRRYMVPVVLSGSVAEEMAAALEALEVEDVSFSEVYGGKGRFRLMVESPELPETSRELLSGILNPIEMIETVLTSFLRHGKEEALQTMARETHAALSALPHRGPAFVKVVLRPKGERFGYRYRDAGVYTREDWLTEMSVVVDTATSLVHELELTKGERTITATSDRQPRAHTSRQRYVFVYRTMDEATVPARLELHVDGTHTLTIGATYRREEKHLLFASRTIVYHLPKGTSALSMRYGTYDLDAGRREVRRALEPAANSRKIERAAELAHKASRAFDDGRLEAAARFLRELMEDYPGTPQGVEARRILAGLRGEL